MQNWPAGNVSSVLVSETKRMFKLFLIICFRGSNLFLTEFMIIGPIITLKGLLFLNSSKFENKILLKCLYR